FQEWAKRADTEVMMAVNLGTRGPEEARNCLEYCNSTTDTYWANLRRKNGFEQPFGIKVWCLGNEMDGDWQMGGKTPDEYGRIAFETAKLMKWTDPSIELVACGSSNNKMPTFVDWEYKVLDHTYEYIDYLSLHQYFGNAADDSQDFLCCSVDMDNFIKTIAAVCDAVKAKKRSDKTVNLSFDEWNVWFHSNGAKFEPWSIAPPQLEDIYNFEDALVVGCILTTLQNNCDRVKMACLAQLVNVIAPIMTENGGKAWAQTIFWPFMYASAYGNGTTLKSLVTCDKFSTEKHKDVPYIESSVVYNEKENELVVYAVNRSLTDDVEINVVAEGFEGFKLVEHVELYNDDLKAVNEKDNERVAPANVPVTEGDTVTVKKHSWNMFRYKA
ncbi:MAG: alpha-N-arabinofuranosidase, partial [Oscillospiraceae bacterium]|nr:alpha-N-arabinofuranosidase [Oscillospiraceae bacterium]